MKNITPLDRRPATEFPDPEPIVMDTRTPTDEEAEAALISIGACTTPAAVRAMQLIGVWSAKLKIPQVFTARNMVSLEEVGRIKEMAQVFIDEGSVLEDGKIRDSGLVQHGCKIMNDALLVEEKLTRMALELHIKSQPDKPAEPQKKSLAPVNHMHVHLAAKPA